MSRPDPFETVEGLINSALMTARVFGENRRASRLASSSVGRLMAELEAEPGGPDPSSLLDHALSLIDGEQRDQAPLLLSGLMALR